MNESQSNRTSSTMTEIENTSALQPTFESLAGAAQPQDRVVSPSAASAGKNAAVD